MKAAEILVAVRKAGATLRVEGNSLVASNASRIAPAIKTAIRANKPQIIAALADPICAVCRVGGDLWHYGEALIHRECVRFLPKPDIAEPSAAYQAASPTARLRSSNCRRRSAIGTSAALQMKPPSLVPLERWRQCVEDGKNFLAKWGTQAEALGWDPQDLFGLHTPSKHPHPSYNRLSRYDCTGLCWLLQGRPVVALTAGTAAIENVSGSITTYRRFNKPPLGPLGDSVDDVHSSALISALPSK